MSFQTSFYVYKCEYAYTKVCIQYELDQIIHTCYCVICLSSLPPTMPINKLPQQHYSRLHRDLIYGLLLVYNTTPHLETFKVFSLFCSGNICAICILLFVPSCLYIGGLLFGWLFSLKDKILDVGLRTFAF